MTRSESNTHTHFGVPRCMQLGEIWTVATTSDDAFESDPMALYINDNKKKSLSEKITSRISTLFYYCMWYKNKSIFTIDGGIAVVVATLVQNGPKSVTQIIQDKLAKWFRFILHSTANAVVQRRSKECKEKVSKMIGGNLGDQVKGMIYIELLATSPRQQGHGFGTALLDKLTTIADQQAQSAWLVSSNVANKTFYNAHGFETVGTVLLGDESPDWGKEPVIVDLMVRKPMSRKL
ncbi:hypothetical protein D9613_005108 [Agrocybe pediades]|uniref:N-acetyltransferase domain-containing protein n=1 Tax=Agrocybe pediades TaxID=84607 RepID=A0A8H4QZX9_9AGAR|nr:hypothetical protein D9613_005108 [Agrocybe pediades]